MQQHPHLQVVAPAAWGLAACTVPCYRVRMPLLQCIIARLLSWLLAVPVVATARSIGQHTECLGVWYGGVRAEGAWLFTVLVQSIFPLHVWLPHPSGAAGIQQEWAWSTWAHMASTHYCGSSKGVHTVWHLNCEHVSCGFQQYASVSLCCLGTYACHMQCALCLWCTCVTMGKVVGSYRACCCWSVWLLLCRDCVCTQCYTTGSA